MDGIPKGFVRKQLVVIYNNKRSALESHRLLVQIFGKEHALDHRLCSIWKKEFKSRDFRLRVKELGEDFDDDELQELFDVDDCQMPANYIE